MLELLARHIRTKGVSEVVLKVLTHTTSAEIDVYLVNNQFVIIFLLSKSASMIFNIIF